MSTTMQPPAASPKNLNRLGFPISEYKGADSTLCAESSKKMSAPKVSRNGPLSRPPRNKASSRRTRWCLFRSSAGRSKLLAIGTTEKEEIDQSRVELPAAHMLKNVTGILDRVPLHRRQRVHRRRRRVLGGGLGDVRRDAVLGDEVQGGLVPGPAVHGCLRVIFA